MTGYIPEDVLRYAGGHVFADVGSSASRWWREYQRYTKQSDRILLAVLTLFQREIHKRIQSMFLDEVR